MLSINLRRLRKSIATNLRSSAVCQVAKFQAQNTGLYIFIYSFLNDIWEDVSLDFLYQGSLISKERAYLIFVVMDMFFFSLYRRLQMLHMWKNYFSRRLNVCILFQVPSSQIKIANSWLHPKTMLWYEFDTPVSYIVVQNILK